MSWLWSVIGCSEYGTCAEHHPHHIFVMLIISSSLFHRHDHFYRLIMIILNLIIIVRPLYVSHVFIGRATEATAARADAAVATKHHRERGGSVEMQERSVEMQERREC